VQMRCEVDCCHSEHSSHDSRAGLEGYEGTRPRHDGNGHAWPELYIPEKRSARPPHCAHSSQRASTPPSVVCHYYCRYLTLPPRPLLLALQYARPIHPGPFPSAVRIAVKRLLDHHKRRPDHLPPSVKLPTVRVRKWISTTHEDNPHRCRCSRHNVLLRVL
jgi:hypothetical protein